MLEDRDVPDNLKQAARERIRIFEGNLSQTAAKMEDCLKMFEEIPKETVQSAFDAHIITIEESKRNEGGFDRPELVQ